jgi:hypothetical protein
MVAPPVFDTKAIFPSLSQPLFWAPGSNALEQL